MLRSLILGTVHGRITKGNELIMQHSFLNILCPVSLLLSGTTVTLADSAEWVDLRQAVVVIRDGQIPQAEQSAATALVEEVASRTGIQWQTATQWPNDRPVIAITSVADVPAWNQPIPRRTAADLPENRAEGYRIHVDQDSRRHPVVWIQGADPRGTLFGVGALLRNLIWAEGRTELAAGLDLATAPVSSIRGHQLGYRAKANSWDAWTEQQYDQYIRELALFGTNAIENIPFQGRTNSLMKYDRRDFNQKMSEMCDRYGLDYWVWTPAVFDLTDQQQRTDLLKQHETLYHDCPRLNGVFFPAGDPGDNPPELVMPFLKDLSELLHQTHPEARVWLSLQGMSKDHVQYVFDYIREQQPDWLGGLVAGPSSPPIPLLRNSLPERYRLRLYPDITHNKLCQYVVPWWDPAYAVTLGREAINPRPAEYARIHNTFAPYSDGFISYSDGVHDDLNKIVWSRLGWDPKLSVREIVTDYCHFFFDAAAAEDAADGILALEKNWQGALIDNASVEGTLLLWNQLDERLPQLRDNWRWQMNLVRAAFDAFTRRRLIRETRLEQQASDILATAPQIGSQAAMTQAQEVLNRAVTDPESPQLQARIEALCADLFDSVQLQTSVEKYQASGAERGAFLDFIDHPLNNRWWLEDRFAQIATLTDEEERLQQLEIIRTWETPGEGSFYDNLGDISQSPHQVRADPLPKNPEQFAGTIFTTYWWLDQGKSRARQSWLTTHEYDTMVVYKGLDPDASYKIRVAGYGKSLLKADGVRLQPLLDQRGFGEFKEFDVPAELFQDRMLTITWDRPTDEAHLNWRKQSRNAEIWLLRQDNPSSAHSGNYHRPPNNGGTYVIAHRGAHRGIPENTLAAYQRAIDLGADFVEIDVRTTKDGEFVSIHNRTVDAYMSDGTRGEVRDFTLEQLKALDIGSRIDPKWQNERVPTFEEILTLCKDTIGIYLDLKDAPVEALAERIQAHNMQHQVVWCVSPHVVGRIRDCCPSCIPMPDPESEASLPQMLSDTTPKIVAPVWSDFSATFSAPCHEAGAIVFVDEARSDPTNWQQALNWDADGIQTDDPEGLIEYLRQRP